MILVSLLAGQTCIPTGPTGPTGPPQPSGHGGDRVVFSAPCGQCSLALDRSLGDLTWRRHDSPVSKPSGRTRPGVRGRAATPLRAHDRVQRVRGSSDRVQARPTRTLAPQETGPGQPCLFRSSHGVMPPSCTRPHCAVPSPADSGQEQERNGKQPANDRRSTTCPPSDSQGARSA